MKYFITESQYHSLSVRRRSDAIEQEISETIVTSNSYKKKITDEFKMFADILNKTNKLTGKPFYDFSDIYPGLKVKYIEPMTENGVEIYINVEESLPREIRNKWYHESYKDKVFSRLYELKKLLGFGYDFTVKVYP